MRLIGREKLCSLTTAGEHVKKWVLSWAAEIANANWKHASEVSAQFPNVRQGEDGYFFFPVNGCTCVICLLIAFPQRVALIAALEVEEVYGN